MTNDSSYSQKNQTRSYQIRRIFSDLWFVVFTLAAVALLALLLSYHNGDAGWSTSGSNEEIKNWFGVTAAYISDAVLSILGYSAYGFAIGLAALGWQNLKAEYIGVEVIVWKFFALMIATLALSGIFSLHWQSSINSLSVTGGGTGWTKVFYRTITILGCKRADVDLYCFIFFRLNDFIRY